MTDRTFAPEPPGEARVLIVEDEGVVAMDIESTLQELGYCVSSIADSAREALARAQQDRPDLVLMDIQLRGEHDGIWAAQEIRMKTGTPVIFITANTNSETLTRAKASGPYGFLNKPFRPKELDAAISIAIDQHRLTRNLFAERSWFSTTMCSMTDGVIATDPDGLARFMNPAAEQLTGWAKADAFGKAIEEVYPLSTLEQEPVKECQLRPAIHTREPAPKRRFVMTSRTGTQVPVEDAASPILEQGQILGAVTTFVDISLRLQEEQDSIERQRQLQAEVQSASEALGQTREELQALSQHLLAAQEEERSRIARDLHDDLGQQIALLGLKLSEVRLQAEEAAHVSIDAARQDLIALAKSVREVSHRLHPSVIADLGLGEALLSLVSEYKAMNMQVVADVAALPPVPLEVATSLYRIAQEALRNAMQHAQGSAVTLTAEERNGKLCLRIQDRGTGFALSSVRGKGGLGLIGMQERARLIGGTLRVKSAPQQGTEIIVTLRRP